MLPESTPPAFKNERQGAWVSLWVVALLSLLAQMALCQFFTFGELVPLSIDVNPSNLWKLAWHFPPEGSFQVLNWLGQPYYPQPLNPFSVAAAWMPPWLFYATYAPVMATLALLAMAAFLRELELTRPAALLGAVIYSWQGDVLPFIYPGHFAYLTTWPFFALAAWAALRGRRTGNWAYAVMAGVCCGTMVGLQPDRGGIISLLIAALYLVPAINSAAERPALLRGLVICVGVAVVVALAPVLALIQGNIVGVKMAGTTNREENYMFSTQFCMHPFETLTYLAPGFFGWHNNSPGGPYWGWIGEWPTWAETHQGFRNFNNGISTVGTMAVILATIGGLVLVSRVAGPSSFTPRQNFYGRVLLAFGLIALVLSWGWHTGLYRPLFALPLMDKWRNPLKWLEWTNFALPVLAAFGVQHVVASLGEDDGAQVVRRKIKWIASSFLMLLIAGALASYPLALTAAPLFQMDKFSPEETADIMSTMHSSLFAAALVALLFIIVLQGMWHAESLRSWSVPNPWIQRAWQWLLETPQLPLTIALAAMLLAVVQLAWVTTKFIDPRSMLQIAGSNPLLDALRSEGDRVRVSVANEDPYLNVWLENQFAAMNISSLNISAASRIPADLDRFLKNFDGDDVRLYFLAGVKNMAVPEEYVPQMQKDSGFTNALTHAEGYTVAPPVSPDVPSHALVGMKDYLEKVTLVPNAEVVTSDEAMLDRLKDSTWDARKTVLLSEPPPPGHGAPGKPGKVTLESYTPKLIVAQVNAPSGGFLLINDQYDPDWGAKVITKEGTTTEKVLRADYIFRAVPVPPGDSTVVMTYRQAYHAGGLLIDTNLAGVVSDGAMVAAWLVVFFGLRRRSPESRA